MKLSRLLVVGVGLLLPARLDLLAQPVPHHFSGITLLPDKTATLSLNGSVSNLFNLTGTISNQFRQMFDLYVVEASIHLEWRRIAPPGHKTRRS